MPIESYGYQVLSLDEVIEALTDIRARWPHMATKPVWTDTPGVFMPVKNVMLLPNSRTMLNLEKG